MRNKKATLKFFFLITVKLSMYPFRLSDTRNVRIQKLKT